VSGLAAGWSLDLPAGAMVVVIAGAVFLGAAAFRLVQARLSVRSGRNAAGNGGRKIS